LAWYIVLAYVLGALSSLHALLHTRTPQGTIAWLMALNTVPMLAVPAWWVFGRSRFQGYVIQRRELATRTDAAMEQLRDDFRDYVLPLETRHAAERLAGMPAVVGNAVELLVDGQATFDSILDGIAAAERSVVVQFYIVRDDRLGKRFSEALRERARAGVVVYFLYDEMGSWGLPSAYLAQLAAAGVRVTSFHSTRGPKNRFQLNFRNHRKIVVVDGQVGWVGGHNVGDEYLGLDPRIGPWRDTHVRIDGPAATALLIAFCEDWAWAKDERIFADHYRAPGQRAGDAAVLVVPSGPADRLETASLFHQLVIQAAHRRVWIASPYFVPDSAVMAALHLAALRGVDVRILIPDRPDSALVRLSAYAFLGDLLASGVRIFRYQPGFMHQKVMLVDDELATVSTANFDNRSFRLNFEVTALVRDAEFGKSVEQMLDGDLTLSFEMTSAEVLARGFWARVASRLAYLTAPIQ
jgi:cardiolipin synthase A/B